MAGLHPEGLDECIKKAIITPEERYLPTTQAERHEATPRRGRAATIRERDVAVDVDI